jgi:maltose alpha-D-glucosyltransferase/alpha-amylase
MKRLGSAADPLWYKDAVIYELHVRGFHDANEDGVGDFRGLIQKLDYLQDLGVTCIWLLPFFPSPLRDDGYDIADYTNVHPSYGTLEDFREFLDAAHARDLQVLIELVVNHTSDQHPWFQAARRAPPGSRERNFYVWSDSDEKYADTRIIFTDTEKSNWTWDPEAKAYYWHRFFAHQPDLNFDNPEVVEEVIRVMRFWLDLGVDALRLDAIPYLVEREGTTCENLPETHAVIKQVRRALDEGYDGRMILAEANQLPRDVQAYFGDGDECHMAFHFPLMPRLFMALRLEDRHPVTEIMAQTPPIPPICQWGLFLRNHDELTLEMVSDEERAYMYLAYSADPRMRINVGIRRRLAPLLENNRRRIELLNSILFSFPGTPILYYGDEIGMGDNIYLGDRNSVRTPMQWSADRNAGFSRANPARLYSPVIMDPVYGYEAVNVEAEQSEASSLLNWTKHMIALRKLFKVFGRGRIEFLQPANRKILAYLRSHENEQILCVANLSRFAQPVELDLAGVAGTTPVEMLGYVPFPKIGRTPYLLTLGPYGFLWFELHAEPEPAEPAGAGAGAGAGVGGSGEREAPAVLQLAGQLSAGWESLVTAENRATLEASILPAFLPRQRWFGGKSRVLHECRIDDWVSLTASSGLLLCTVRYANEESERYVVPVALAAGPAAAQLREATPDAVLCPVAAAAESGVLFDGLAADDTCLALLGVMSDGAAQDGSRGVVRGSATRELRETRAPAAGHWSVRRLGGEQSNTSVVFGDRYILKLFRRLQPGPQPDCEITRYLTEQNEFARVPPFAGSAEYVSTEAPPATVAMVQHLVANQGDGWRFMQEELSRYYEVALTLPAPEPVRPGGPRAWMEVGAAGLSASLDELLGVSDDAAAVLGRCTGALHLALGRPSDNAAFSPEPLTAADLAALADATRLNARGTFDLLKDAFPRLPDDVVETASHALGIRGRVLARLDRLRELGPSGRKIRIHGDYHLGQVLRTGNDFVIIDFEGEPVRSLAQRRSKQSPLRDVAGMLRSFSYAAHVALLNHVARRPGDLERLTPCAAIWERSVCGVFLHAYVQTVAGAGLIPDDRGVMEELLEGLLLDKVLYELRYELDNRPSWVRAPLAGLLALAFDALGAEAPGAGPPAP